MERVTRQAIVDGTKYRSTKQTKNGELGEEKRKKYMRRRARPHRIPYIWLRQFNHFLVASSLGRNVLGGGGGLRFILGEESGVAA